MLIGVLSDDSWHCSSVCCSTTVTSFCCALSGLELLESMSVLYCVQLDLCEVSADWVMPAVSVVSLIGCAGFMSVDATVLGSVEM